MKKCWKKVLAAILGVYISILPAFSLDLDLSVDEEIKKKYDAEKLKYDALPPLPKTSPNTSTNNQTAIPKTTPIYDITVPNVTKADSKNALKIGYGTKFPVRSNQVISDWLKKGNTVTFTTTTAVSKSGITIPAGTKFYGVIEDSHRPQKTGNGGLVVIKMTSMTYNGQNYSVNAKITKANSKKIFLNNIKGQRLYWKNVGKQIDKGENFYKKSRKVSAKFADNPIGLIIASVPTIVGVAGYTVVTATSPITAIFSTGGNLSIPSGSAFEIKLTDPAYVK
ncbi:hypothetical protein HDR58_02935 [bacterium]|nr:hypothetical protein [bacterium]